MSEVCRHGQQAALALSNPSKKPIFARHGLGFVAVALHNLDHRQTVLELGEAVRHDGALVGG
ncbi:MAG TPA: hypothetical protein VND80_07585 [Steroidobacteraceae bacterium]|nr:hypothetical protein [Steroidobacteraceae bacterium]